ncbi:hypothetical protein I7I48_03080 [Histoplasma ohiense]|nr:hypothetical protein I7I48_03080 [Histoplasma ohiense (nom. inval.)]
MPNDREIQGYEWTELSEACAVHGHGQSSLGVDIWPLVDFVIIASAQTDQHPTSTRFMASQLSISFGFVLTSSLSSVPNYHISSWFVLHRFALATNRHVFLPCLWFVGHPVIHQPRKLQQMMKLLGDTEEGLRGRAQKSAPVAQSVSIRPFPSWQG